MSYLNQFHYTLEGVLGVKEEYLPLSPSQYNIWLEQQLYPDDIANNIHFVAKFSEEIDLNIFQIAIQELAERHESIRTIFPILNEIPTRRLVDPKNISLQVKKCCHLSEEEIKVLIQKNFEKPFALSDETPFRFFLYQKSNSEYYFQIVIHHIAITMVGYIQLLLELAKSYVAQQDGKNPKSHDNLLRHSHFVEKYREYFQSDRLKIDKDYWLNQLSGNLSSPILPLHQTSDVSDFVSDVYHCDVDTELTANLKKIANSNNSSFFSLMTAAFQVLQSRYTKQEEIIVGIPNDVSRGFTDSEVFRGLIECTINTLPLRSKVSLDQEFSQFVSEVSNGIRNMSKHRIYPMGMILEDLRAEKGLQHDKLYKIIVVSQKPREYQDLVFFGTGKQGVITNIDGFKYESTGIGHLPTGRFDLALAIVEIANKLVLSFHYNALIFKKSEIEGLVHNYLKLLSSIAINPHKKNGELSLISHEEQHLQLNAWNCMPMEPRKQITFLECFEKQVATDSEAIAIVFEELQLSYGRLNHLSNQLARYLQKLGITKNSLIGIGVERSPELIIALIAVIKAGGAYLPLDPEHPKERIDFMLEDSRAEILITQQSSQNAFCHYAGTTVFIDKDWDKIAKENALNLSMSEDPDQLAYVIYTSGSTGRPKGVEIAKKSLDNLLTSMQQEFNLSGADSCLASTTISFDISNLEIFLPLRQGSRVVLTSHDSAKDPSLLSQTLEKNNVTFAQATPSTWQMLADFGWQGRQNLTILCGGEALSQSLAERLVAFSCNLWNMYGPTETTIWSSMKKIENPKEKITIGRPIGNTTFYILDENTEIQPIGVPGELYIGGIGLAKGYRNNLELTNERFVQSNFANIFSTRLYKTGDLARYLPNGEIECLGRIDHQVKIRGYRIELGEIEETLKKCKGIQQAVAVVHEDEFEDKRIVAYCIGNYNQQEIKEVLNSQLPDYMIPATYIQLDQLPLTPNGKIDRKALPAPTHVLENCDYSPPRTPTELAIVQIFENLLHIDKIGINLSFFSLGGHSLLVARAITQINRLFKIRLPLKTLFEKPTAALVAQEVELALKDPKSNFIQKAPKEKTHQLSYSQQRFWFLEQQTNNSAAYSIPFLIELVGGLDIVCLQRAIDEIVKRHEILRSVFREGAEGPEQLSLPNIESSIVYKERSNIKAVKDLVSEESMKPFDLGAGPLFRFTIIKRKTNDFLFFVNFHHIIFDGHSITVFIEELKSLYTAYRKETPPSLPDLSIQYTDYIHWQKNTLKQALDENQVSWWVEKLQDAPFFLNLPTDKPRPPIQTYNGALLEFLILDKADLTALKSLSQKYNSTLFIVLLAVFHVFLYRYTGQNDLIIGVPVSGRNHSDLDDLIGCFINTLALRTTSDSNDSFIDFLKVIRDESFEAFNRQDVPFEKVVEKIKIERILSHSLLFQVMFNMIPEIGITTTQDFEIKIKNVDRGMAHLDLSLSVQDAQEGLRGFFEYNTDLFLKKTIERMSQHFQRLLKAIINNPEKSINKLQLLSDSEIERQIIEWNKQPVAYSKDDHIIQRIEKWAEDSPNTIAVICREKSYSYYELNTEANKIAHVLIESGIKSEDRVLICLERSAEFISTILGILKAGGVYVPLDPEAPQQRIEAILKDLCPSHILTHSTLRTKFSEYNTLCIDQLVISTSHNPLISISEKQLAYIIYTSGSTGTPKGVEIEHMSINDRVFWKNAAYPLGSHDVMLHTYSFIFDGAIINYFWPLCAGASLIIASKEEQIDPIALIHLIQKHEVTTMDLLPSVLEGLVEEQEFTSCSSIKTVFSGGEALPNEVIDLFYKKCNANLHNTYGPTEATVEASAWVCKPNNIGPIAPIGKPIAGAKLYILDKDQNIVPIGVPGELHIGGIGLARGYFNSPLLTAEKFIQDIFSKRAEDRLYRTGDLVKYLEDGNIEFLGRIDNQTKIRGFRVDLKEIESSLLRMNFVEKAIVIAKGDGLHKRLIVYAILTLPMIEGEFCNLMKTFLGNLLPAYMIPQQVVILDSFPTLLNGKINYNALEERKYEKTSLSAKKSCTNELENQLLLIWKEVLGYKDLTITDNFFEIGGNSLLAMRLIGKIKNRLGISTPLIHLFQNPNIEAFANSFSGQSNIKTSSPVVLMQNGGDKKPFFCVHPIGGGVLCYRSLAKYWTCDRAFYAIQAHGLEKGENPRESIGEMAREYIKAMREVQPVGPYILGGWSFGGLIASEMVNQLQKQNEEILFLVLIDTTSNIEKIKSINIDDESLLLSELTNYFIAQPVKKKSRHSFKEQFVRFIESGGKSSIKKENSSLDRLIALAKANYRAIQTFSIPTLDINVALIRSQENPEKTETLGWNKYASKIKVFQAPGDHWAITQENEAPHYAKILQNCLALVEPNEVLSKIEV